MTTQTLERPAAKLDPREEHFRIASPHACLSLFLRYLPPRHEARLEERVKQLRHLLETLDLLYDAFGQRRLGAGWAKELVKVQKWLQRDERGRLSAIG